MVEKIDNPQDHQHSDHWIPGFLGLLVGIAVFLVVVFEVPSNRDLDRLNQRIDELECRLADDETACLKDILEETR